MKVRKKITEIIKELPDGLFVKTNGGTDTNELKLIGSFPWNKYISGILKKERPNCSIQNAKWSDGDKLRTSWYVSQESPGWIEYDEAEMKMLQLKQ